MAKERANTTAACGWPSLYATDTPIVAYIEICGETFPYTERMLWDKWQRGGWIPDEWSAYFCELEQSA